MLPCPSGLSPTIVVTGAAGFIGSALCRFLRSRNLARVIGIDKMSYAASREALASLDGDPLFRFVKADINDSFVLDVLFGEERPCGVIHLAAETHVDRSIDDPSPFVRNNIVGTFSLLESSRRYWSSLPAVEKGAFRFLHVSTDEVFGSLENEGSFTETSPYAPNSPYAASKAGSDHLARAWSVTYGLPVLISNCSNNYGPFQFPEKLIPLCLTKALAGEAIPVYGQGQNVRDWLFVDDHAEALHVIFSRGRAGETYNIGGGNECRNIELVRAVCSVLDEFLPGSPHRPHEHLITFVPDRPGHDFRYAMDSGKISRELGWSPRTPLIEGLRHTIRWYLENAAWRSAIHANAYRGERLGLLERDETAA